MPRNVTTTRQASTIDLAQLTDAAFAALNQPMTIIMRVEANGTATFDVLAPDGSDTISVTVAQIRNFVNNHVAVPRTSVWDDFATEVTAATTLAECKTALINLANILRAHG
jgi:hypothetical protein